MRLLCANWEGMIMRDEFVTTLLELARRDPNLILLTGDLGFGIFAPFISELPGQFVNAGVAEQNMSAMATGMALEGKIVFTYSIANFSTLRCLEQIRNDACYHRANVKVVSVGGGLAYGALGISHHATEDLSIMRALPDLTVFTPGDPLEARAVTRCAYETPGACYLRLGRAGEPPVHSSLEFRYGRGIEVIAGKDCAIITAGGMLKTVYEAAIQLKCKGIDAALYSIPTLKPLDHDLILQLTHRFRLIATVEENTIAGGLGGAVAEITAQAQEPRARLLIIGLPEGFASQVGDQDYLRNYYGISSSAIVRKIMASIC